MQEFAERAPRTLTSKVELADARLFGSVIVRRFRIRSRTGRWSLDRSTSLLHLLLVVAPSSSLVLLTVDDEAFLTLTAFLFLAFGAFIRFVFHFSFFHLVYFAFFGTTEFVGIVGSMFWARYDPFVVQGLLSSARALLMLLGCHRWPVLFVIGIACFSFFLKRKPVSFCNISKPNA